jgi:5-methylcytosine-specific restriction endonuclease McrA
MTEGKVCTACRTWQPLEGYHRHARGKFGRGEKCRACVRLYRTEHREQRTRQHAAWLAAHPGYYRQRYAADRERAAAEKRAYTERDPERWREYRQSYAVAHRAQTAQRGREHYAANREHYAARIAAYRQAHPEMADAMQERRRARLRVGGGDVPAAEWRAIQVAQGHRCLACGQRCRLTMDHVVPLARGGRHETANIQGLCLVCNARKGTRIIDYRPARLEA